MMFVRLLLLFTIVPVVELYILIKAGQAIGTMNTVALVILTGIVGASFAKSQGAQIISKIRNQLSQGQLPGRDLLQGAIILAGGILLVTPGFITDVVGLSLLFPLTRKLYTDLTLDYFKKKFESGQWKYSIYDNYRGSAYNEPGDPADNDNEYDSDVYQVDYEEIDKQ
jgi:UPF0716 protein FxsA